MNTLRLTIALAILLLILLIFKFITEPFAPENILAQVMWAVGVLATGLIWGLILYLPARLFQGPDNAPELQGFVIYTAVIFLTLFMIYHFIR